MLNPHVYIFMFMLMLLLRVCKAKVSRRVKKYTPLLLSKNTYPIGKVNKRVIYRLIT